MRAGNNIGMFTLTVLPSPAGCVTVALVGSVGAEAVREIDRLIEDGKQGRQQVVLDLGEVTLLDRAVVRFLAGQLRRGIELVNCPAYIEHWISRENHEPKQ